MKTQKAMLESAILTKNIIEKNHKKIHFYIKLYVVLYQTKRIFKGILMTIKESPKKII